MKFLNFDEPHPELINEQFRTADFPSSWGHIRWPEKRIGKPSVNRVMLIIRGIDVVLRILQGENSESVECFRLYFETVSDSFLLVPEVEGFLKCLTSYYYIEDNVNVGMMVNTFQAIYPESGFLYEPTTLQHMCRCTVREILGAHEIPLPFAVERIFIPKHIEKYVLCV